MGYFLDDGVVPRFSVGFFFLFIHILFLHLIGPIIFEVALVIQYFQIELQDSLESFQSIQPHSIGILIEHNFLSFSSVWFLLLIHQLFDLVGAVLVSGFLQFGFIAEVHVVLFLQIDIAHYLSSHRTVDIKMLGSVGFSELNQDPTGHSSAFVRFVGFRDGNEGIDDCWLVGRVCWRLETILSPHQELQD